MLITNNKGFQIITMKSVVLNNVTTNASDNTKTFNTVTSTKCVCSHKGKHIIKYRDDNKLLYSITFTKYLRSHASKDISKDNKDSDLKNKATIAPLAAFTKYIARCKTAHAVVESSSSKEIEMLTLATIIQ